MHPQLALNLFEYSTAAAWLVVLGAAIVLIGVPAGLQWLRRCRDAPQPRQPAVPLQPATRRT